MDGVRSGGEVPVSLWAPQRELIAGYIEARKQGHRKILLQLPTGGGKTEIFAYLAQVAQSRGLRALILADRRELVTQAASRVRRRGADAGVIMAAEEDGHAASIYSDIYSTIQVASVDTLVARCIRRKKMELPDPHVVIVDEAHLSVASKWLALFEKWPNAIFIGVTATPTRKNGRALGEFWETLVLGWSVDRMIQEGFLVPVEYRSPSEPDLSTARIRASTKDYEEADLEKAMVPLVGDAVEQWRKFAEGRRTIAFCVTRDHARAVWKAYNDAGIRAVYVDGETKKPDRKKAFAEIASGEARVLVNVFVASYGLDIPAVEVIQILRPTRSLVLYMQMVGRALRLSKDTGKVGALVLDHSGAVRFHGFVEDEIPWALEYKGDIRERKEARKRELQELKAIQCPKCSTWFKGDRVCPKCYHEVLPKGHRIPTHEADLTELRRDKAKANKAYTVETKRGWYGMLLGYAQAKGYAPGWAYHKFKEKFGVGPAAVVQNVSPAAPSPEIDRWIKSRNIAFAKGKASAQLRGG